MSTPLQDAREARGLSKRELARLSGVNLRTIRRIENEPAHQATIPTLVRLAATLETDPQALTRWGAP